MHCASLSPVLNSVVLSEYVCSKQFICTDILEEFQVSQ
jgi:hypothetical protein